MLHDEVDKLLEFANELLDRAENEAERSAEDVVTHLICTNSRQSIANYLAGFLMQRNIPVQQPVTLQGLLDQCKEVDARFESMDMAPIHCRCKTTDDNYCLDNEQVDQCMSIAQQARSIVMSDTPGF